MRRRAFLSIILGAILWGTIGWYVKNLYMYGFTPMEVVSIRAFTASSLLIGYFLLTSRSTLKLKSIKDIKYFIGTGIFSIIFFNYCLFTTINLSTIPIATALLYTGPAFVTILSFFLFHESFTKTKLTALGITFIGTCFVVGLLPFDMNNLEPTSIFFGLGAGFGYALYSIFSKYALTKYSSRTITTYTFTVAMITLLPFFPFKEKLHLFFEPIVLFYSIGLGFLPTAFAYIIYTYGLQMTEASKAAILTTIEPVVATLIGLLVFHESFTWYQMVGMLCIIGAVILIQLSSQKHINKIGRL